MGLVHTPRVISSVLKGVYRHSSPGPKTIGFGPQNIHSYYSRLGLFDVDYLGHMNNAAFLNHAEYARWELTATSGMLQHMYKTNTHYFVAANAIRYRRELRPLFRRFEVQTHVAGLDDRNIWMYV